MVNRVETMVERNIYVQFYTMVVNKADNNRFSGPYWEIQSPRFQVQPDAKRRAVRRK